MKQFLSKLNICSKTSFISLLVLFGFAAIFCWLIFLGATEVYCGLLLGLAVNTFSFFLMGLGFNKENYKMGYTITLTVVRFLLIGAALFLSAFLYYKQNVKIFNVFAVVGGYAIPLIIYLVNYLRKGE